MRLLAFLCILFVSGLVQGQQPQVVPLPTISIFELPTPGPATGTSYLVNDSSDGGCTNAGGSTHVTCESNGSSWVAKSSGGGTLTASQLRTSLENVQIIDVNPAEPGTTSAGIQEAIDACPAAGCIIQFRENTTYTLPQYSTWSGGDVQCMSETNGKDNIWFRGYGPGSTVISYINAITTNQVFNVLFCVETGSNNILVSNIGFISNALCTTVCAPNTYNYIWRLNGNVKNIRFENNEFDIDQAVTVDASAPNTFAIELNGWPDVYMPNVPHNVEITKNVFHGTDSGSLHAVAFDNLIVTGNFFDFRNLSQDIDAGNKSNMRAIAVVGGGQGFIFSNNVIDFAINGIANPHFAGGVMTALSQDFPTPSSRRAGSGWIISNNHFKNMRTSYHNGIRIGGTNDSIVEGNIFSAGACNTNALYSCADARDCQQLGGAEATWTCNTTPSRAIWFETNTLPASTDGNQGNLVRGNIAKGMQDTGTTCPFYFEAPGSDANSNLYNVLTDNVMRLNDATQDGICGDAGRIAGNQIQDNYVFGSAITKPPRIIARDMTETIVNGADEGATMTPVFSHTIPANMLGATGALRLRLSGVFVNPTTAGTGLLLRIQFGGVTMYQNLGSTGVIAAVGMPINLDFVLQNQNATNAQRLVGAFIAVHPQGQTVGSGAITAGNSIIATGSIRGTGSIDTTAARILEVAFSIGGTAADNVLTIDSVLLELL